MTQKIKPHIISTILAGFSLFFAPVGLFIIFMSGDSCCGEDTRGTMAVVTLVIIGVLFMLTLAMQGAIAFIQHQRGQKYPFILGILITWLPSAIIYTLFFLIIALTAF